MSSQEITNEEISNDEPNDDESTITDTSNDQEEIDNVDMIPCEMCNQNIHFDEYADHIENCMSIYNNRVRRFNTLNNLVNILNFPNLNNVEGVDVNSLSNINETRTPLEADNINETDDNDEYNEVNETNEDNGVNNINEEVINTDDTSDVGEVTTDENNDNETNVDDRDDVDINMSFLTRSRPLLNRPMLFNTIPNIYTNIGRELINNIELNIGNLHNLTNENNNTEYDFNLLIQELMGGNVNIGVKDFNKIITPLKYDEIDDDDECSICFDNLKNIMKNINNQSNLRTKINIPIKTTCGHKYCRDCLYKWLSKNKNCPVCNNRFEEDNEMPSEDNEMPSLIPESDSDTADDFIIPPI